MDGVLLNCAGRIFTLVLLVLVGVQGAEPTISCRYRSDHLRQDGGLCFELPPWQHQPVILEQHLNALRQRWSNMTSRRSEAKLALSNSEITRYMDTVLAPFLHTYHRNIQNSYQQMTDKTLRRIKDALNAAVQKKQEINAELTELADKLKVPPMCDEERRDSRTVASKHVARMYDCTEEARATITKMGKYAEEMISITKNYMHGSVEDAARMFKEAISLRAMEKSEVHSCIQQLSKAAVVLGYELDLSLTNARRHNEQSCEKLTNCISRAKKNTEDSIMEMTEYLYQCVYA